MNEISADEAEAIIEAAARGAAVPAHAEVGAVLTELNSPGSTSGFAPPLAAPTSTVPGRIIRRTAVAASAAVLGLATVAAATTGGPALLDPILGGPDRAVEAPPADTDEPDDADDAEADDMSDGPGQGTPPAHARGPENHGEGGPDHLKDEPGRGQGNGHQDIDGVDPSDGVDEEELALACEAVDNHGRYVSLVARDKITETDGTHGDRVSDAAKSDCGKDDDNADGDGDKAPDDEAPDDETEAADESSKGNSGNGNGYGYGHRDSNGKGHGQSNGNGNGNGNGHGHGHTKDAEADS